MPEPSPSASRVGRSRGWKQFVSSHEYRGVPRPRRAKRRPKPPSCVLNRREGVVSIARGRRRPSTSSTSPAAPNRPQHVGAVNLAQQGDELPPGWIITKLKLAQAGSYTEKGLPISFEVWVEPKPAQA